MKLSYILFFLFGVLVTFGLSALRGSNAQPAHHVYEGKMDALKDRFGNHTDAIFKRHDPTSFSALN
jgi:hypothetical protein